MLTLTYFSKLVTHVSKPLTTGPKIHDTTFSSLSLRLNHPYWLVHSGDCEHFLVVDQIRYVFSLPNCHLSLTSNSAYSTLTTPHPGTRLPRKSRPHYSATVARVRRSQLSFRSSEICVSVKVRASCVHPAGGTWACQEAKTPTVLWLSHSPSMNLGGSIHDLYHPIPTMATFSSSNIHSE
jgi:hypothetical protein